MSQQHTTRAYRNGKYDGGAALRGHTRGPVHPLYASADFTTRCVRHAHPCYDNERVTSGPSWLFDARDESFVLRYGSRADFFDDDLTIRVVRTKED